ncbi:MAG: universal stress protein [Gemmatimonadota bacterium]|jgi:nucleotide-binding universal stress UspA family protein
MRLVNGILHVAEADARLDSAGFRLATRLAKAVGARLTLVRVTERPGRLSRWRDSVQERVVASAEARSALVRQAEEARSVGVDVRIEFFHGLTPREAVAELDLGGPDLVIKDLRRDVSSWRSGLGLAEDQLLARDCPFPLWLVHPTQPRRLRSILAALKVDEVGSDALADEILRVAAGLAAGSGAELHVVHALPLPGAQYVESLHLAMGERGLREVVQELERRRREVVEAWAGRALGGPGAMIHVEAGDVAHVIDRVADRVRPDLVVMGSTGRTGLEGILLRNAVQDVVDQVECSVLTLGPTSTLGSVLRDPRLISEPHEASQGGGEVGGGQPTSSRMSHAVAHVAPRPKPRGVVP